MGKYLVRNIYKKRQGVENFSYGYKAAVKKKNFERRILRNFPEFLQKIAY